MLLLLLACAPKPVSVDAPLTEAGAHPLLFWEVEKNGHKSHLLGTCHLGIPLEYALPAPESVHLDQARVVYTEAALPQDQRQVMKLVIRSAPGLAQEVGPEAWHHIVSASPGLPATLLDRMRPWGASLTASLGGTMSSGGGAAGVVQMDKAVQLRAEALHIPIAHVETLEEQAALLGGFDGRFLEGMRHPEGPEEQARTMGALDALCRAGNTDVLDVLLDPADPTTGPLLGERNRAWLPKLLPDLTKGSVFVAVGAAHMLGEAGLLALLQEEGFTVRQARTDRPVTETPTFVPPAPGTPYDPTRAAAVAARLQPVIPNMCGEQSPIRQCFYTDDASCLATTTRDIALCADQHSASWPVDGEMTMAELNTVSGCVFAGTILAGLARADLPDTPVCKALQTALPGGR